MPAVLTETFSPSGNRTRCYICFRTRRPERANQPDDATAPPPKYICHHCGRLICQSCADRYLSRPHWVRRLFRQGEMAGLVVRGQRQAPQLAHCTFHRLDRIHWRNLLLWLALPLGLVLALIAFLWRGDPVLALLWGLGGGLLFWLPALLYDAAAAANDEPFLPVVEQPNIQWIETLVGKVTLGARYEEQIERSAGEIRVRVPFRTSLRENLASLARAHQLDEEAIGSLPVVAGTLVFDRGGKVRDISWPRNSRRWTIGATVDAIPALADPDANDAQGHTFTLPYTFNWQADLPKNLSKMMRGTPDAPESAAIRTPFPVQVHASFAPLSERQVLELRFAVLPAYRSGQIVLDSIELLWDLGGAEPRALRASGQVTTMTQGVRRIEELVVGPDGVAEIQITLPEMPDEGQPYSVGGIARFSFRGSLLSELGPMTFYNAFGERDDRVMIAVRKTQVELTFQIDAAQLPYHQLKTVEIHTPLQGTISERMPDLMRCLESLTMITTMREAVTDPKLAESPSQREFHGRMVAREPGEGPMWYHLMVRGPENRGELILRVTAGGERMGEAEQRARAAANHLNNRLELCMRSMGNSPGANRPTEAEVAGEQPTTGGTGYSRLRSMQRD